MFKFKVIPINYKLKRLLMSRIRKLKEMIAYVDIGEFEQNPLKNTLIRELKFYRCLKKSYSVYLFNYRGVQVDFLVPGSEFKLKTYLLCKNLFWKHLGERRKQNRKVRYQPKTYQGMSYQLLGGCHEHPGEIKKIWKNVCRKILGQKKTPEDQHNYVGLEVECFGKLPRETLEELLVEKKMYKWSKTVSDTSIQATDERPNPIEMNFIFKESELNERVEKIGEILKAFDAEANNTCGLHVHLDARHRDPAIMYHNLVIFQSVLFQLNPNRIGNQYCTVVTSPEFGPCHNHYAAISASAYAKYKTIEVRIHGGTVDPMRIKMWVKLLTKIANYPTKLPGDKVFNLQDVPNISEYEINYFRGVS